MRVDIMVPSYRYVFPQVQESLEALIDHSRCKCALEAMGTANDLVHANAKDKAIADCIRNNFHSPDECPYGKHDIWTPPTAQSCAVHWTRNQLLMMARPDFDYVLFCDDDIIPEPDYLDRLLMHKKDIVVGLCTRRVDPPEPNIRQWIENDLTYGLIMDWEKDKRLIPVDGAGTGFMLISRKAVDAVAMAYHPETYAKISSEGNRGNGWWFEWCKNPHDGEWGEDISFVWKALRIGIRTYCDTSVQPKHIGDYFYSIQDYEAYKSARIKGEVGLTSQQQEERSLVEVGQ